MLHEERRPPAESGAHDPDEESGLSLPPVTAEDWQRAVDALNGALAVLVYANDGKVRRRVFMTVASAERHARRARQRGYEASAVVVQLLPAQILPAVSE